MKQRLSRAERHTPKRGRNRVHAEVFGGPFRVAFRACLYRFTRASRRASWNRTAVLFHEVVQLPTEFYEYASELELEADDDRRVERPANSAKAADGAGEAAKDSQVR